MIFIKWKKRKMSKKKNKKSELKRQLAELWEQLEREKTLVVLLKNSCEMATDGWCQALKYWRRTVYSGIRRANRWMWFSFLSNMFWMILVAMILFENGGE